MLMKKATSLAKSLDAINAQLELLRKRKIQAILRPLHRERKKLLSRLEEIDHTIGSALGERNGASQLAMKTIARGRKRIRRSGNELKQIAGGVVEYIRSKGTAGVTPAEIKAAFGKLLPSPAQFVKKHAGVQLKRKGPAKRPRYYHG